MKNLVGNFTRRLLTTEPSHAERLNISAVQKAAMERSNDNGPLAESRLKVFLPKNIVSSLIRSDYGTSNIENQLKNNYKPLTANPSPVTPEQHKKNGEKNAERFASHIVLSEPSDGEKYTPIYVDELKSETYRKVVLKQIENIRPKATPSENKSSERDKIVANIIALRHGDGPSTPEGKKLLAELESKASNWQDRIASPSSSEKEKQ